MGRVGTAELTALLTIYTGTQVFLNYPARVAEESVSAAWMVPLVSGVVALLFFWILYAALKRFPGEDLLRAAERVLGVIPSAVMALLFAAIFLLQTALVMREFTETVVTTVLPETPSAVIAFLFMGVVVYYAYKGLEGLTRMSILLAFFLGAGILLLLAMSLTWFNPHLLEPLWGRGGANILSSGLMNTSQFMNLLILAIVYPAVRRRGQFFQIGSLSIALTAILFSAVVAVFVGTFSGAPNGTVPFPLYQLARLIYLGRFVQRLEAVFVFLWTAGAVIQMGFGLWMAAYLYASVFRMPVYRPILFPFALLLLVLANLPPDFPTVLDVSRRIFEPYGWIFSIGVPTAAAWTTVAVDALKNRRREAVAQTRGAG